MVLMVFLNTMINRTNRLAPRRFLNGGDKRRPKRTNRKIFSIRITQGDTEIHLRSAVVGSCFRWCRLA